MLTEMLRHCVSWDYSNWDVLLPMAEFAHNNARSSATGASPFYVCTGKHPRTPVEAAVERPGRSIGGGASPFYMCMGKHPKAPMAAAMGQLAQDYSGIPQAGKLVDAWEEGEDAYRAGEPRPARSPEPFIKEKRDIVDYCRRAMEAAHARMKAQQDKSRKELTFKVGGLVSLKTTHLGVSTLPSRKLFPKFMGPFRVNEVVNAAAYRLELPQGWRAHDVFHVSLLRPYISNGEAIEPMSFTLVGGKDSEYEVEAVLDYEPKTRKHGGHPRHFRDLRFKVKWLGLPLGQEDWQPFSNLQGSCDEALKKLAVRFGFPPSTFEKGNNKMPESCLPPPPHV